jgi:anaerobic selenocysteine-containing dehydrogenase
MGKREEIHNFCGVCHLSCAVVATVEDGKLISVKPDKDSDFRHEVCPQAKGPLTLVGVENHPNRLKHPLRRAGKRGEGKWEQISWDEALDTIAAKLLDLKAKYGPESFAILIGEPKSMETIFGHRLATAFGTPNVITPGGLCGVPRQEAYYYTLGRSPLPDCPEAVKKPGDPLPKLLIFWGADGRRYMGRHVLKMKKETGNDMKIVVIDPMRTWVVDHYADWWIRPRPASDGALAMGLLKIIIEEELYDKDFVAKWTVGFDKFREEIKKFTIDDVAEMTWIAKEDILKLARLYAKTKPASIQEGNSLEFMANSFDTFRVTSILRSITGNLNVPGGDVFLTPAKHARPGRLMLLGKVGRDKDKMLGKELRGVKRWSFVPYQALVKANLDEGYAYPIRAVMCCLTNPIISYPDSVATYNAFMKMDLIVVQELFHTPTTCIADIVLPAAWTWEDTTIGYWGGRWEEYRSYKKVVDPPGEAWTDAKIYNELGKRMGLGKYFYEDEHEALDELLEGSGITFKDFLVTRKLYPKKEYKKPEEDPFRTPSGKVEIYSERLAKEGLDTMPTWEGITRFPKTTEEYPLILTSYKENSFMLTGFKMIDSLRRITPVPIVRLNPETAKKYGLEDGEWIYIETPKGRITQKLQYDNDTYPKTVNAAWGWWYPEDGPETMYGWKKSNFNILTGYEVMAPPVGTPEIKGIPCRVSKTEGEPI